MAMASLLKWKPIKNAPKQKYPLIVVHGFYPNGLNDGGCRYTTYPYCVFWQNDKWERWPHRRKPPTHYLELPDNLDEWEPIKSAPRQKHPLIVVIGHYPIQKGYMNTEPCCVFWNEDYWARWIYSNINPTHYLQLPPLIEN
jgi:hypothetical protein